MFFEKFQTLDLSLHFELHTELLQFAKRFFLERGKSSVPIQARSCLGDFIICE
jgi:hypothetical protein